EEGKWIEGREYRRSPDGGIFISLSGYLTMGRRGTGVEIREKSIRLNFTLEGKQQRHTLMLNGELMPPTPANVKYANRLAVEIRDRIKHGTFSMIEYFPASGAGGSLTVADWLTTWL